MLEACLVLGACRVSIGYAPLIVDLIYNGGADPEAAMVSASGM